MEELINKIINGDSLTELKKLPSESVDCVITSPPYWALNTKGYIYGGIINSMFIRNNKGQFVKGQHISPETEFKKGQHWRTPKPYWNKEWLYEEYVIKRKSAEEIAKQHGCIKNNIFYWLSKHKIKTRDMSETRKIKYWGLSGIDNPMFNKKGELNPNWRGGITKERQTFYSSIEWKKACSSVWKRDKTTCRRCSLKANNGVPFHIHHIIPFREKKLRADVNNLILLCEVCHRFVHSNKNERGDFIGME